MVFARKSILRYILLTSLFFEGCVSIDRFNTRIDTLRSDKELISDVNFVQHKLEKLHPDLYHYIPKKELDGKFDSLRQSLTSPMTSKEFYFRLSPVIASIKQGHTQTIPILKKLKYHDRKIVNRNGTNPLARCELELFDNRLYIVNNHTNDSTIKPGTEVVSIDGVNPKEIIDRYSISITSDGNNATYIPRRLGKGFQRYFYYEHGIKDSLTCQLKYRDTIRTVVLKRLLKPIKQDINKTRAEIPNDRLEKQKEARKRRLLGYDPLKKTYSMQLSFPVRDSSIAIMKINDFMKGNYRKFYKMSFHQLDTLHTKTLILDLRDNGGGLVHDINILYSYLADSSFHLVDKSEVVSRTSLWHFGYYNNNPAWLQAVETLFLPFVAGIDIYTYLKTRKDSDHKYYFAFRDSKLTHVKPTRFKGKIYVLINGGCFSATSILSSNLKGSKRALFVGQETGGAYNGCVAGIMPVRTLPNSKLSIRFGLLGIKAHQKSGVDGRGISPDVEIIPTLEDRVIGKDPETEWVLDDIKGIH